MRVSASEFDALINSVDNAAVQAAIRATFTVAPEPKAGQLYTASNGQPRLLVRTKDGQEAVVNPKTGRLLTHEDGEIFTSWAERIETDGYVLQDSCECD